MVPSTSIARSLASQICRRRGGAIAPPFLFQSPSSSFSTSSPAVSPSLLDSSSSSSSQSQEKRGGGGWKRWLLFAPGAITFGLGTWQLLRREEKIKMLDYRRKRLEMEPVNWNKIAPSSENLDSLEFRRVLCKGVFDENKSIFLGPRSRSVCGVTENGYYLITPLLPIPNDPESVQSPVLVNRGWVPRSWRDNCLELITEVIEQPSDVKPTPVPQSKKRSWWKFWVGKSEKAEETEDVAQALIPAEVVGVIRGSENPSIFVPENDPSAFQWFYVDVRGIAHARGLPGSTAYIEDINEHVNPGNPYPIPKDANTLICSSVMPRDHINYTLTWYSLSVAVTYMAFKRLKPKRSKR